MIWKEDFSTVDYRKAFAVQKKVGLSAGLEATVTGLKGMEQREVGTTLVCCVQPLALLPLHAQELTKQPSPGPPPVHPHMENSKF